VIGSSKGLASLQNVRKELAAMETIGGGLGRGEARKKSFTKAGAQLQLERNTCPPEIANRVEKKANAREGKKEIWKNR